MEALKLDSSTALDALDTLQCSISHSSIVKSEEVRLYICPQKGTTWSVLNAATSSGANGSKVKRPRSNILRNVEGLCPSNPSIEQSTNTWLIDPIR